MDLVTTPLHDPFVIVKAMRPAGCLHGAQLDFLEIAICPRPLSGNAETINPPVRIVVQRIDKSTCVPCVERIDVRINRAHRHRLLGGPLTGTFGQSRLAARSKKDEQGPASNFQHPPSISSWRLLGHPDHHDVHDVGAGRTCHQKISQCSE